MIDRDQLEITLGRLGFYAKFASILAAADAGAVNELVEVEWGNVGDQDIISQLRQAASDTGYLARRLAGLAGAYSPKKRPWSRGRRGR